MFKKRNSILMLLPVILTISLLIACTPAQRPGPTPVQPDPSIQTPQDEQPNQGAALNQRIAERINKDVSDINAATVVLSENQAWVGVDVAADKKVTDKVKERISSIVKEMVPGVQNVFVTADVDAVTRIKNIANNIASGQPVSGFINELSEIARRIEPMPR